MIDSNYRAGLRNRGILDRLYILSAGGDDKGRGRIPANVSIFPCFPSSRGCYRRNFGPWKFQNSRSGAPIVALRNGSATVHVVSSARWKLAPYSFIHELSFPLPPPPLPPSSGRRARVPALDSRKLRRKFPRMLDYPHDWSPSNKRAALMQTPRRSPLLAFAGWTMDRGGLSVEWY